MGLVVLGTALLLTRVLWELWYRRSRTPSAVRLYQHAEAAAFAVTLILAGFGYYLLAGISMFVTLGIATAHLTWAVRHRPS